MQTNYFKILLILICFPFNTYAKVSYCEQATNSQELDINNVKAKFWASGSMWLGPGDNSINYSIPQDSKIITFYSFDLWMSAIDEFEQKRLTYQLYSGNLSTNTYFPGPLGEDGFGDISTCEQYDRVWKINKSTLDSFRLGLLIDIPKDILEWPAKGNPHILFTPERDLAPFIDVNQDNVYNPLDGDFPEILGDQSLWWVFNDVRNWSSFPYLPLQCEVQVMAYAYNSIPELQNHTFYKYTFTNRAAGRLDSMMIGMRLDADLGQFDDDYVGCDTLRDMGIIYNGDDFDGSYGEDTPLIGIKLLQGPQKKDGIFSGMYTFWDRQFGFSITDFPDTLEGIYLSFFGMVNDTTPMTYGGHGFGGDTPTRYMYPSDPSDENGWSECSGNHPIGDRTMFLSTGPFSLERNEQKELHFVALWVQEGVENPCPSFAPIQDAADYVQDLFDNGLITNIEEPYIPILSNTYIHLFPNPITSNTRLYLEQDTNHPLQKGELMLFDSLGKLVQSIPLKATQYNESKISALQSGMYFYQLQWQNGKTESGKLMVQ